MADEKHFKIIKQGVWVWNRWREANPEIAPDLSGADLPGAYLFEVDFRGTNLHGVNLSKATLTNADLRESKLRQANLDNALLNGADLSRADLTEADLSRADLNYAKFQGTSLRGANLSGASLIFPNLNKAIFSESTIWPNDFDPAKHGLITAPSNRRPHADFTVTFAPELSPEQIKATLEALADYYRACGGIGFKSDFELEDFPMEQRKYA